MRERERGENDTLCQRKTWQQKEYLRLWLSVDQYRFLWRDFLLSWENVYTRFVFFFFNYKLDKKKNCLLWTEIKWLKILSSNLCACLGIMYRDIRLNRNLTPPTGELNLYLVRTNLVSPGMVKVHNINYKNTGEANIHNKFELQN